MVTNLSSSAEDVGVARTTLDSVFVCLVRFEKIFVAKFLVAQFAIGFVIEDSQTADATNTGQHFCGLLADDVGNFLLAPEGDMDCGG